MRNSQNVSCVVPTTKVLADKVDKISFYDAKVNEKHRKKEVESVKYNESYIEDLRHQNLIEN